MAVGNVLLMPGAATQPDGSTGNLAPALQRIKSSASAPGIYALQLAFDATNEEWCTYTFRMPDDYASAPTMRLLYKMATAITGAVVWDVRVSATTSGDATDVDALDFAAANTVTSTVPATAGYLEAAAVTLTADDDLAAGDLVVLRIARAATDAADTATGKAELVAATLAYLTV